MKWPQRSIKQQKDIKTTTKNENSYVETQFDHEDRKQKHEKCKKTTKDTKLP